MGWTEAADNVLSAMSNVIQNKTVIYDLERLMV
jgi:isocitrate dehydrogenase